MTFRCAIFAAVSSRPQVEKESIPSQIANARACIQRRDWQETVEPLIVPGESRDIDFLHEAMEEVPAIHRLIELARVHTIDLVVVRDYDRLARTRTLLTQISTYLNRCNVQIYALNKPVEPLLQADLTRVGQASLTSTMVEAFAGIGAQQEIERLRDRRRFGMDGQARRGLWKHVSTPFGYTRELLAEDGTTVYLDVPEIIPEQADIITRVEARYLEGQSMRAIARALNLEAAPSANGAPWSPATISQLLHNPFYSGWIVWGLERSEKVYNPTHQRFVNRAQPIHPYAELLRALDRHPNLRDILNAREQLIAAGAVIEKGQHTPLRTEERQDHIDQEIAARVVVGGRGAALQAKIPRIFVGLLRCARCDGALIPKPNHQGYIYYRCRNSTNGACDNKASVREDRLYTIIVDLIGSLVNAASIDAYLDEQGQHDITAINDTIRSITGALTGVTARRARWDDAYASGVIDLSTYGNKLGDLEAEAEHLRAGLVTAQQQLQTRQNHTKSRERLLRWKPEPITETNRQVIKKEMRSLVERILVDDGKIIKVIFK